MSFGIPPIGIGDFSEYFEKLRETQKISEPLSKSDCMHINCPSCHGTGVKDTGGACIHGISCPCKNCRTYA